MKKIIIILSLFVCLNAKADIQNTREEISSDLNSTVKDLKGLYHDTDVELTASEAHSQELKSLAEKLVKDSDKDEVNPTVLSHGTVSIKNARCDYDTQTLAWDGNRWTCLDINLVKSCQAAARDEYIYEDADGNMICSKSPKGESVKYFWSFTGYSKKCDKPVNGYNKLYGCFYKNKRGHEVQVDDSYCKSKHKPGVKNKTCQRSWAYTGWSGCSKSCGGGTKTRKVYCPKYYICVGVQPSRTAKCNTNACAPANSCSSKCSGSPTRNAYEACMGKCSSAGSGTGGSSCNQSAVNGCGARNQSGGKTGENGMGGRNR